MNDKMKKENGKDISKIGEDYLQKNKEIERILNGFFDLDDFKESINKLYSNFKNIKEFYGAGLNEDSLEEMIKINKIFKRYDEVIERFKERENPIINDLLTKYYSLNPEINRKMQYVENLKKDFENATISKYVLLEQELINLEEKIDENKIDLVSDEEEVIEIKSELEYLIKCDQKLNSIRENVFNGQPIKEIINKCKKEFIEINKINRTYKRVKEILSKNKKEDFDKDSEFYEYILNKINILKKYSENKNILNLFYLLRDKKIPLEEFYENKKSKRSSKTGILFKKIDNTNVWISHLLSVFIGMSIMGTLMGFGQCDYNELIRQNYLKKQWDKYRTKQESSYLFGTNKKNVIRSNKKQSYSTQQGGRKKEPKQDRYPGKNTSKILENLFESFYYNDEVNVK